MVRIAFLLDALLGFAPLWKPYFVRLFIFIAGCALNHVIALLWYEGTPTALLLLIKFEVLGL